MKKFIGIVMIAALLVTGLAACGSSGGANETTAASGGNAPAQETTTAAAPTENAGSSSEGYSFTYNGTKIQMHAEASAITDALGEPKECTEAASCVFEGMDKTYFYGSFYLVTYPKDDKEYVYQLWFTDDTVETEEGICIGDSVDKVKEAYGVDEPNAANGYEIKTGDMSLTIGIKDDKVDSVMYVAEF